MDTEALPTLPNSEKVNSIKRLSIGCVLDELLAGGVEPGIITNIYGPPGAGKTVICLHALISCVKNGKKAIYMDTENGFSTERLHQLTDLDILSHTYLLEPTDFEEQKAMIKELKKIVKRTNIGLIVVDSFVMFYRLELSKDNVLELHRELGQQLKELAKIAREKAIPIIITNHVYTDIEDGIIVPVGGDTLKYWSKCMISLEKARVPGLRRATLIKHRSLPEGRQCEFRIVQSGLV
jgi:DNA repair protein RadB